jgi:hypothetical protein
LGDCALAVGIAMIEIAKVNVSIKAIAVEVLFFVIFPSPLIIMHISVHSPRKTWATYLNLGNVNDNKPQEIADIC